MRTLSNLVINLNPFILNCLGKESLFNTIHSQCEYIKETVDNERCVWMGKRRPHTAKNEKFKKKVNKRHK